MPKLIQKRSLETQERILMVTRDLFDNLGQPNVTTDMIANKANVAKGTVFAHFTDRSNLIAAVGLEDLDRLIKVIGTECETPRKQDLIDQFMFAYGTLLKYFAEKPEFAELFIHQSVNSKGKWSNRFNEKCLEFEVLLGGLIQQRNPDANETAHFLVSGAQAFFLQIATYQQAGWMDLDEATTKLRKYLVRWFDKN